MNIDLWLLAVRKICEFSFIVLDYITIYELTARIALAYA